MKRILCIGGLVALGLVAPLSGEARNCISEGCPKNQKPSESGCCAPPPCGIYDSIRKRDAEIRMWSGDRLGTAVRESGGDFEKAKNLLGEDSRDEGNDEIERLRKQGRCAGYAYWQLPDMKIDKSCQIRVDGKQINRNEYLKNYDGCLEAVEADFDRISEWVKLCINGEIPADLDGYAREVRRISKQFNDDLKSQLQAYLNACTTSVDKATKAELASVGVDEDELAPLDATVDTLKKKSAPKPKPPLPAKTAKKRGAR